MKISELPQVIAILRGIQPDEALDIGSALMEAGIRIMEVPLNSPRPLQSIARLREVVGDQGVTGAGTVIDPQDCQRVLDHGGSLIVSPHMDAEVVREALRQLGAALAQKRTARQSSPARTPPPSSA